MKKIIILSFLFFFVSCKQQTAGFFYSIEKESKLDRESRNPSLEKASINSMTKFKDYYYLTSTDLFKRKDVPISKEIIKEVKKEESRKIKSKCGYNIASRSYKDCKEKLQNGEFKENRIEKGFWENIHPYKNYGGRDVVVLDDVLYVILYNKNGSSSSVFKSTDGDSFQRMDINLGSFKNASGFIKTKDDLFVTLSKKIKFSNSDFKDASLGSEYKLANVKTGIEVKTDTNDPPVLFNSGVKDKYGNYWFLNPQQIFFGSQSDVKFLKDMPKPKVSNYLFEYTSIFYDEESNYILISTKSGRILYFDLDKFIAKKDSDYSSVVRQTKLKINGYYADISKIELIKYNDTESDIIALISSNGYYKIRITPSFDTLATVRLGYNEGNLFSTELYFGTINDIYQDEDNILFMLSKGKGLYRGKAKQSQGSYYIIWKAE